MRGCAGVWVCGRAGVRVCWCAGAGVAWLFFCSGLFCCSSLFVAPFALQPSGGNQVDGLPPAPSLELKKLTLNLISDVEFRYE